MTLPCILSIACIQPDRGGMIPPDGSNKVGAGVTDVALSAVPGLIPDNYCRFPLMNLAQTAATLHRRLQRWPEIRRRNSRKVAQEGFFLRRKVS